MRGRAILLIAATAGLLGASTARGEDFNEYESLTITQATSFTMVLEGDVVSSINTTAMETDATVNPFYWVIVNLHGNVGTSTVTATLDAAGNTVVTFTGPYAILNGETNSPTHPPHFGLDPTSSSGAGPKLQVLTQYWSNGTSKTLLPSVTVQAPALGTGPVKYEIFFANVSQGSQTVGEWFEIPYTGATPPQLTPTVTTDGPVTLSNVGFQLSPTLIPLDNLNFGSDSPPGSSGSPFTAEPQYDGPMNGAPEPSTWAMLLLGVAGLACAGHYRGAARNMSSAPAVAKPLTAASRIQA